MHWFQAIAPIRLKLFVAFGSLIGVMALVGLIAFLAPTQLAAPMVALLIGGAAIQCMRYRVAIADPYVSTVVRMEALAAGDLTSPIQFGDYRDCVGRMTKAMLIFRDNAAERARQAEAQSVAVRHLGASLARLTRGDLTAEVGEGFPPGYAALKTDFNAALGALRGLIGTVMESAATIRTGSHEIAQAAEDLARRTEANAASLEQTSAAVAQMDLRLKTTAEAAGRTVARADDAIATVAGGRGIADEAVQAMTRVSDSAKGIDGVIEGLDKIAFQTRVLAMNGRGFAVVADLVSALAMRAEEEAGRAREQLTATQADIGTAVDMVRKVDGALADISGDVGEVHALLGQMAGDNQAQAAAITQISTAIGDMDRGTQQNAAMVEQSSAAARKLAGEVAALGEQAATFNVGTPARTGPPSPPRKRQGAGTNGWPARAAPATPLQQWAPH
jgi:methyl-accepting chemotaxis protein